MSGLPAATRSSKDCAPVWRRAVPEEHDLTKAVDAPAPAAPPPVSSSSGSPFSREAMSTFAPQSPTTKPTSSGVSITLIGFATAPSLWIA